MDPAADPAAAAVLIPVRRNPWRRERRLFRLGVEHILTGIDHLLFVLALLLITRGHGGW